MFFWGLIIGGLSASLAMYVFLLALQLRAERNNQYKRDQAKAKAALRRKEAEVIERHDEFVYYDSTRAHSCFFRALFCPHYGKITSERVDYSHRLPFPSWRRGCGCFPAPSYLQRVLAWPWARKVQSFDIKHDDGSWSVADVELEQGCVDFLCNTGTVVLHVPLDRADASMRAALEAEEGAKTAERGAAQSKFVTLPVRSVDNPTDVFDDLSYKIRKNKEEGRR